MRPSPNTALYLRTSALLAALGALAYGNSLSGPFVLDDQLSIVANRQIRSWSLSVLAPERDSPFAGRPLVNLTFAINYAVHGLGVAGYHVVNIAIHLVCALLVFGLVRRTLELPTLRGRFGRQAPTLAFATALIWVLHPLNSEAVDYLTQRTESLMALFYLLTLYATARSIGSRVARRWQVVTVLACALGMACKESMVTAPLMVVLYDAAFGFDTLGRALRARWRFYACLAATWLVLATLVWSGPRGASAGFSSDVGPWTYLLNQTVMLTRYLRLAIWPRALVVNYGWPLSLTFSDVAPYFALIVFLLLLVAVAWIRQPRLGFLGLWFFMTLAPTSSVVPIATEVGAERRMYLPLVALSALVVIGSALLWNVVEQQLLARNPAAPRRPSRAGWGVLVAVAVALFAGTWHRNREYASQLSLIRTAVDRWPSSITQHILGAELMAAGDHEEAVAYLRAAIPGDPRAHTELGVELFNEGKLDEAIEQFQTLIQIWESPPAVHAHWQPPLRVEVVAARVFIGRALAKQKRWQEAIEEDQRALAMAPDSVEAHGLLGEALFAEHKYEDAIPHYREYLKGRPSEIDVLENFGIALVAAGNLDDAIAAFRRAVDLSPENAVARRNLEAALQDRSDAERPQAPRR